MSRDVEPKDFLVPSLISLFCCTALCILLFSGYLKTFLNKWLVLERGKTFFSLCACRKLTQNFDLFSGNGKNKLHHILSGCISVKLNRQFAKTKKTEVFFREVFVAAQNNNFRNVESVVIKLTLISVCSFGFRMFLFQFAK
jgi:hypothetical protein